MNCQYCVYYRYESDINFWYCIKLLDEERLELEQCPDYYDQSDAKYGGRDKY